MEIIVNAVVELPNFLEIPFKYNLPPFGNGACAYILPKLFELKLEPEILNNLKFALATALTQANHNIGALAAKGVRDYLWSIDEKLAEHCLNGVIEYSKFRIQEQESSRFYYLKDTELKVAQKKWDKKLRNFRQQLLEGTFNFHVDDISLESHASWLLHIPMLSCH
ncbi:hypothetical protein EVX74_008475 [Acinetobacter lwoffii]|uniref:Uncharacterized protein n=1 Tax=Acinetobacter lwoffii TaxID=28090 RepID=A0AAJ4TSQ2_ACILW|nr:hypothetical protein EVX74_008475 [Acinetobacter lwoffii]